MPHTSGASDQQRKRKQAGQTGSSAEDPRKCKKCGKEKPLHEFKAERKSLFGRTWTCKECANAISLKWNKNNMESLISARKRYFETNPWAVSCNSAKQRCTNKNDEHYIRYGGRGIKFLMTSKDFKFLWHRDNAQNMKSPTIDRINNDGNYELSNCRFIERSENGRKGAN
jgi:hypothetical protein